MRLQYQCMRNDGLLLNLRRIHRLVSGNRRVTKELQLEHLRNLALENVQNKIVSRRDCEGA